jgi:hypothetical protein
MLGLPNGNEKVFGVRRSPFNPLIPVRYNGQGQYVGQPALGRYRGAKQLNLRRKDPAPNGAHRPLGEYRQNLIFEAP